MVGGYQRSGGCPGDGQRLHQQGFLAHPSARSPPRSEAALEDSLQICQQFASLLLSKKDEARLERTAQYHAR